MISIRFFHTVAMASALAASLPADAGLQNVPEQPVVSTSVVNGQMTGKIAGTMRAFKNNPDPNAYANLSVGLDGTIAFSASLNGKTVVCFFPDTYDAQYAAAIVGDLENSKFTIYLNGATCSPYSRFERGSQHPSYSTAN